MKPARPFRPYQEPQLEPMREDSLRWWEWLLWGGLTCLSVVFGWWGAVQVVRWTVEEIAR